MKTKLPRDLVPYKDGLMVYDLLGNVVAPLMVTYTQGARVGVYDGKVNDEILVDPEIPVEVTP